MISLTENRNPTQIVGNTSDNRDAAIDIARGIAVVLVFLGHISLTPTVIKLWLQSFHIPLFFICSGLVFSTKKTSSFKDYLLSQIRSLFIPIFSLGILLFFLICFNDIVKALISHVPVSFSRNIRDVLISLLLGYRRHKYYFSLWFLAVLFFGRIVFYFITKLFNERSLLYLVVSFPLVILQWFLFRYVKGFYWSLDLLPACLAFLSVGYFLKISKYNKKFYPVVLLPASVLISIIFAVLNYKVGKSVVDLYSCYIGNPVYYYTGAVVGSWMILIFSHFVRNSRVLEFFGKNSLVLYAFNNSFAIPFSTLIIRYLSKKHELLQDPTAKWLFIVICSLSIGSFLAWIIMRFVPWIIGKKGTINYV